MVLNKKKTEGIWLGELKNEKDDTRSYENVKSTTDPVKSLGLYYEYDKEKGQNMNIESKMTKIEKFIKDWSKRHLSSIVAHISPPLCKH